MILIYAGLSFVGSYLRDAIMYSLFHCYGILLLILFILILILIKIARVPERDTKYVFRISGPGKFFKNIFCKIKFKGI